MSSLNLLAVDKTGSSVCLIDAANLRVLKRLRMPVASHDFALSPDRKRAFISIYGEGVYGDNPHPGHQIVVVDLQRFEIAGVIDIAPYSSPHGIAFDTAGVLWVSCDADACVLGISPVNGQILHVVATRSTGSHWVLADDATGELYTSNKEERFLSVIDSTRGELTRIVFVPHGTEGICFSADGRSLYAADHERAAVLEIDLKTRSVRRTIELAGLQKIFDRATHHMRVCASADGTLLAVAAHHFDRLVLVDLRDLGQQLMMETGRGPTAMAFHPHQPAQLYFSNHDEGSIGVIDTLQGRILRTTPCHAGIEAMRFLE